MLIELDRLDTLGTISIVWRLLGMLHIIGDVNSYSYLIYIII